MKYCHVVAIIITSTICFTTAKDDSCVNGVCQGVEGDEVVIPCGDQPIDNATYTYYNYTSKYIILPNSNDYLVVNLTAFMDNTQIHCVLETSHTTNYYTYTLSVLYAPVKLSHVHNQIFHLYQAYTIQCPLSSNPPPSCSWEALYCFNASIAFNLSEYGLVDNGCQLYIEEITVQLMNIICLQCTAVNVLGSDVYAYNSLQIVSCPEKAFTTLPQGPGPLVVEAGDNLTLICDGYGFGVFGAVYWCFNDTISLTANRTSHCFEASAIKYDTETCLKRSVLTLTNLNTTNTGIYQCYFSGFNEVSIEVMVTAIDSNKVSEHSLSSTAFVCIVLSAVFLAVSALVVVIALGLFMKYRSSSIVSKSPNIYTFSRLNTDHYTDY